MVRCNFFSFFVFLFFFAPLEKPLVFLVAFALFRVQGQEIFEVNEWFFLTKFMILSLNFLFLSIFQNFPTKVCFEVVIIWQNIFLFLYLFECLFFYSFLLRIKFLVSVLES